MSQAFVREGDDESLNEITPTMNALIQFLTRDNNGIRVYEKRNYKDDQERTIVEMSNGISYTKDEHGRWTML